MSKRSLLIILASTIAFLLIGGAIYYFLFQNPRPAEGTENQGFLHNLFPFGEPDNGPAPTPTDNGSSTSTPSVNGGEQRTPTYALISANPVSGAVWAQKEVQQIEVDQDTNEQTISTTTVDVIRYVERSTGHVYETQADTLETRRISNTTLPKIQEALWSDTGNAFSARYLDDTNSIVQSLWAVLTPPHQEGTSTSEEGSVATATLPQGISSITVSPAGDRVFYLISNPGGTDGFTGESAGSKTQVFSSPISELLADWAAPDEITLLTKPSGDAPGYVYALSPSGGVPTQIIGGMKGLSALMSPDGKQLLYSTTNLGAPHLFIFNREEGNTQELPVNTFAEKCVWGSTAEHAVYCAAPQNFSNVLYPDTWYQGRWSSSDRLVRIDTANQTSETLLDPVKIGEVPVDAMSLSLNADGTALLFTNKKDLSLWKLDL